MRQMKLRHAADVRNSNVDKVIVDGEHRVRLCNYVDVYKNDFIYADMEFSVGSATATEIANFALRVGDVIITKDSEDRNDIGVPALVRTTAPDLICGYHLSMLRAKPSLAIGRFLFWALLAKPTREAFSNAAYGITRYGMTLGAMKNVVIPLPDLPTQKAIADFLDRETARIDLLIEKKQRLVERLGESLKAVINRATTVGFRGGKVKQTEEKWLGEVATNWRVAPLKWFVRLQSGFAFKAERFSDHGTRLVRMNNLKRGALDLENSVCVLDEDVNRSVMLCEGDIILGMSGSIGETGSLGNFAVVVKDDLPCLLNQRVGRFQILGDEVLPDYLTLVIQSPSFLDPLFLAATSTAQFNVSPGQVGAIMFALPPTQEQSEIVNEVAQRSIDLKRIKDLTVESIDRLREFRAALITAAVTGQIDPETWSRRGTTDRRLDQIEAEMGA